jgi:HD superfamily phosphodiesterase
MIYKNAFPRSGSRIFLFINSQAKEIFPLLRLPVKYLKKGMIVAQSIFNHFGGSYLVKGSALTPEYIRQLRKLGIPTVNVTSADPSLSVAPPPDVIQEKTRVDAILHIYQAFDDIKRKGSFDAEAVRQISDEIIYDLIDNKKNLVQLTDIRLHDTYTFGHSVNVAVLSAMIGLLCHYTHEDLLVLTLGALFHDLGKLDIPENVLTKTTSLTDEEFSLIKTHPEAGAERINALAQSGLPRPAVLAAIAREHHERVDGKGYPRELEGEDITRFAEIVAIADVYDALTSERPYKKAYTPNVAYHIMTRVDQGHFNPVLLKLFFNNVALYPVGTILQTTKGYAIVKKCEFGKTQTPTIVLFADPIGNLLPVPRTIDLSLEGEKDEQSIQMVISGRDLRHFIHKLIYELKVDPSIYLQSPEAPKKPAGSGWHSDRL